MTVDHRRRREAAIDRRSGGVSRALGGTAVLLAVGAGAWLLLTFPGPGDGGADTSRSADMQDPEMSTGVDTRMTATPDEPEPAIDTHPAVMRQDPPAGGTDQGDLDRMRIAELERDLASLRARQGADPDLETVLRQVRESMRAEFDLERALADENYRLQLDAMSRNLASGDPGMDEDEREARRRLEEERQRRAAISEAQIMSDGIVLDASGARTGSGSQVPGGGGGGASGRQQTPNEAFMARSGTLSHETVRATRIPAPDRTIMQGTTLNAVLETAISTELPGIIRAVVTDDVMSYDGMNPLLPKGTRLIGAYNSDVSVVQDRVQIAWNRAVTPDGASIELGGYGADGLGMSGQSGFVDTRFGRRFGSAALISLMGAGPEVVISRGSGGIASDVAEDLGDDLSTATRDVMGDFLSAGPVIYVDQGTYMTVFVNRDLVF